MRYIEITYIVGGELDNVLYYTPVQEATNAISELKTDTYDSDSVQYIKTHPSGITICAETHTDYVDGEDEDEDVEETSTQYTFYIPEIHPLFTISTLTDACRDHLSFKHLHFIEHNLRLQLRKLLTA